MKYFWNENQTLTQQVDDFFHKLSAYNQKTFDNNLSVLLLGSMSRGEATWTIEDGISKIISDLEFFTIYPKGFDRKEEFESVLKVISKRCFPNQDSVLFHIDNTWISIEELPKLPRKVITYDAMNMGKIVVGDTTLLNRLPKTTLRNINREDIWDIMVHRIFYVLYYGHILRSKGKIEEYRYTIAKNSLDLMTVILACNGILNSGFYNKLESIKNTTINAGYKEYLSYCLDIKLNNKPEQEYSIEDMENIFISLIIYCKANFRVGVYNRILNAKYIIKRRIGILKRMVKLKQFSYGRKSFLNRLIHVFEQKDTLNSKMIRESYILNSYPQI